MDCTPIDALAPELWGRWVQLHERMSPEVGPLLHPAYARAAQEVRKDVEVGVITQDGDVVGFLPFQRTALDIGRSVGDRLCDQSGAVVRTGTSWSPVELARAIGLTAIRLTNCITLDPALHRFQGETFSSSIIDLSAGFHAYLEERTQAGSGRLMRQIGQRSRKAEREVGPLRFEWNTDDDVVFETLLEWKAAQRRATRSPNILAVPWARSLVDLLRDAGNDSFGGVVSALYYGDTLAAAHMGIRSRDVLHFWITAYNDELSKYSPGLTLLVTVAEAGSTEHGIRRIELGVGDQRFKLRTRTGAPKLATTTVTSAAPVRVAFKAADGVRSWSRESRVGQVMRATRRVVKRGSYMARGLLG